MNTYAYEDPQVILKAEKAIIDEAEITKKYQQTPDFKIMVLVFLVGALSFAVALSYNNFAQAIIKRYSLGGDDIWASFINLLIFTGIALGLLYGAWKVNPTVVGSALG